MLEKFEDAKWSQTCMESEFSHHLTKTMAIQMEANTVGDGRVIPVSQKWVAGLSIGKTFMKKFRDLAKTKFKQANIVTLSPAIMEFLEFLEASGCSAAASLRMRMWGLKSLLFGRIDSSPGEITVAWDAMTEVGLVDVCAMHL